MRKRVLRAISILLVLIILSSVASAYYDYVPSKIVIMVEGGPNPTDGQLYDHDFINGKTIVRTVIGSDYYVSAEPNLILDELYDAYDGEFNTSGHYTYSVEWSSSDSKVAAIYPRSDCYYDNFKGAAVSIRAVSNGKARITAKLTIEYWISSEEQHHTTTVEDYFDVKVSGTNGSTGTTDGSDTEPNTPQVPDDYIATIPKIDIAVADKTIVTNKEYKLAMNKSESFSLALQSNIWQEGTLSTDGSTMTAYVNQDAYGNLIYLQVDTISWQVSGDTGSVSKTSGTGGSFTLTGKQSGTVTLTATAPCSYLVRDGERWVDQGIAGIASASTTIQVAQGEQYHNPFANASEDVEVPFADLDPKAWYAPFVKALAAAGFYVGCDFSTSFDGSAVLGAAGTGASGGVGSGGSTGSGSSGSAGTATKKINFNASTAENRANTVVVFYNGHKAIGGNVGSYTKNPFWDVSSSHSYYQPVLWGSAQTIVKGYGQGTFGPANGITREQFCTILLRYADYAGIPLSASKSAKTFTDGGSISSWAKDAVVACQKAGIINGYPDGSFRPQNGITRAEVSKMIYMFFNAIS